MPTINNYTVTSVVYTAASGDNVYTIHPTAVLTITPNEGYEINANDFSWINTDLNYINTVVFTQDGNNILCTVTFDNPFTMPASDIDLALCIVGEATISQTCCDIILNVPWAYHPGAPGYDIQSESPVPEETTLTVCGAIGQTVILFTRTYTCSAGYFWTAGNIPLPTLNVDNVDNYLVNQNNITNSDGQIISTTITVSYIFSEICGSDNVTITLFPTTQILVPVVKITSYTLNTSDVGSNGTGRTMRVYGAPGATFELASNNGQILNINTTDSDGDILTYTTIPIQTIPDSGYFDVYIVIPASGSAAQYCFTLTGDLLDPFPQANPVCIDQYGSVTLTFNTTGSNLTVTSTLANGNSQSSSTVTKTYPANNIPIIGGDANINKIEWLVQTSGGQLMTLVSTPTISWTNYDEPLTTNSEEVQLSTIVPVVSVTGITTGMRMVGSNVTIDGVPPEATVDAINSTNLTISPQQLLIPYDSAGDGAGSDLVFSNRKGTKLNLPVTVTLDAAGTTAKVKVGGEISKYGDTSQTFTLDLTSLITVGSTNTCCTWTLDDQAGSSPRGGALEFVACSGSVYTIKVPSKEQFTFCGLTTPAATYTTVGDGTIAITTPGSCNGTTTCYTYTYVYTGKAPTTTITYIDCTGHEQTITVGTETSGNTFCGQRWDPVVADSANTVLTRGSTSCS